MNILVVVEEKSENIQMIVAEMIVKMKNVVEAKTAVNNSKMPEEKIENKVNAVAAAKDVKN